MKDNQDTRYSFSLIMMTLVVILVLNYGQEVSAQLEIPEAEPIGTVGSTVANTSNHLVFEDLGYKIEYPDNWDVVAPGVLYGLSAFLAPDGSVLTIKFIPAEDADVDNLDDLADLFQEEGGTQVAQFYKNSSTLLGGLPAFIQSGVYTYTPTVLEALEGKTGYTNRVYQIWGQSEEKNGFYGVLFGAASKSQYDENLPVVKVMINSFTVEESGQVIEEFAGGDSDAEGPDDTFVGSADDNDEENDEGQEND